MYVYILLAIFTTTNGAQTRSLAAAIKTEALCNSKAVVLKEELVKRDFVNVGVSCTKVKVTE